MRRKIGKSRNDWPIDSLKVDKDIIATLTYLKAVGKRRLVINHLIKWWKILKEIGISDHLTWLLRNLYAGQQATVKTGHGTTDWFQIGKGVHQGCILSPCLLNLYTSWETLGWKKHKLESRLPGEISITSDMQIIPTLWQKAKNLKEPLDESETGEWKSWLKVQHSEN